MNQRQDKNWWDRNWKWFVPVCCVGSLALLAGVATVITFAVFGMMKSSDVYKDAVARAKTDPYVQTSIGTPIEEGLFISGNINISGTSGQANLSIPVSGPEGKATIYVIASKSMDRWTFSTLVVEIKKSRLKIDLLE